MEPKYNLLTCAFFCILLVCITDICIYVFIPKVSTIIEFEHVLKNREIRWAMEGVPNDVQLATVRSNRTKEHVAEYCYWFAVGES